MERMGLAQNKRTSKGPFIIAANLLMRANAQDDLTRFYDSLILLVHYLSLNGCSVGQYMYMMYS